MFGNELEIAGLALKVLDLIRSAVGERGQAKGEHDDEKSAARLVYWEVAYNCIVVGLAARLMPVRVLATRHAWDRPGAAETISRLIPPEQLPLIAGPYLELDIFERLTSEPHPNQIGMRFLGADRQAAAGMASRFRLAEETLRPHLFDESAQDRLAEAWAKNQLAELKPLRVIDKVASAASAVPPWVFMLIAGLLGLSRLSDIEQAIRRPRPSPMWRRIRRDIAKRAARLR